MKYIYSLLIGIVCNGLFATGQSPFTAGNLVIYRVGDGSVPLSFNKAWPVFLDEYTPSGTLVQSIAMPTTVVGSNKALTAPEAMGSSYGMNGLLTLSSDKQYLLVPGYNTPVGSSGLLTTGSIEKTIGLVNYNALVNTTTGINTSSFIPSGTYIRSAASSNGTDLWITAASRLLYTTVGAGTAIQINATTVGNTTGLTIADGQLYVSGISGTGPRLGQVGSGLPTTSGQTVTQLPGVPATGNPTQFVLLDIDAGVAGVDVLYVADATANALRKYSLVGGVWTLNGQIGVDADDYGGLTANVSGGVVNLYIVRGSFNSNSSPPIPGEFVTLTDASGYNGAFSGTPTSLIFGAVNTQMRGIAFVPTAPLPTNDDAPGATTLTVGSGCTGAIYNNTGATKSTNEVYPSCSGSAVAPVWFKFVAPASGAVKISTDAGSGNTFSNSKVGLFAATNVNDYSTFSIISCDDDGGNVLSAGNMSVLYATGLTNGTTYYIAVDKANSGISNGTFCITVDELSGSMVSASNTCASSYQTPTGSNATYTGWVPLLDASSNLVALARKPTGGTAPDGYTVAENVNTGVARSFAGIYYLNRNYLINNAVATNTDVQFFYTDAELLNLFASDGTVTASTLGVVRQAGSTCQANFSPLNGPVMFLSQTGNGVSADGNVRWVQIQTPSFSNFYLQSGVGGVLPISLLNLSGYKDGAVNKLKWTTASESNNHGFEVQRSTDGTNYMGIGFVNTLATGGNSSGQLNYSFTDNNPSTEKQYYRLKQTDNDNRSKLSNIIVLSNENERGLTVYPNPVQGNNISVQLNNMDKGNYTVSLYNSTGQKVFSAQLVHSGTSSTQTLKLPNALPGGMYQLELTGQSIEKITQRLIINR